MAKDGTNRGGRRPGAGRKRKALAEKAAEGRDMKILDFGADIQPGDMPEGADIPAVDVPEPSEYLAAKQAEGGELKAAKIYTETMDWICKRGCGALVNHRLVESYADAFARFIQCSEAVSQYGLIGKHPTTGAPIANPFTQLEQQYQKQAFMLWSEIWSIIKANSLTAFEDLSNVDPMERLLSAAAN